MSLPGVALTLCDIFIKPEIIVKKSSKNRSRRGPPVSIPTSEFTIRILQFLGYDYQVGKNQSPKVFISSKVLPLCSTYYTAVFKNPIFFQDMVLRSPLTEDNHHFIEHVFLELHGSIIKTLDLSYCHEFVNDELLISIFKKCKSSLRVCILWGCHDITDDAINILAEECQELTCLNVSGCFRISDEAITNVTTSLLNLDTLNLSGLIRLTDKSLQPLYDTSRLLQTFDDSLDVPSPDALQVMPSQFRRFSCIRVDARKTDDKLLQFIVHFESRPRAINKWISEHVDAKYKPFFCHGNVAYKGICKDTILSVLNVSQCKKLSTNWHRRISEIHPGIHIVK